MAEDRIPRRLAAIMAVDVVGYSRLMGEDEAGTAAAVRAHREAAGPLVASFGGRLVKTMGDGLLLEFPSAVAAVECALAIQTLMTERNADVHDAQRIVYRVGVNVGDVLIEGDDILGEGVNIAARLEAACEPGAVLISGAAHEQVRGRVAAEFFDLGEKALKNIALPVRCYALGPVGPRAAPAEGARPPRLSLVVLPFANLGGGDAHEYFVDGVTESLTTDLSRIRGAFVIGRNTAFTYKGRAVDLKRIGRELNVRYALEGSVQRGGDRMRVNVQLINAESGHHLWAERFDKPLADLFDMQDEIVSRLAVALNVELAAAEARRAQRDPSPDSMDHYFLGLALLNKGVTPQNDSQAKLCFQRALRADRANVDAQVGLARVDLREATGGLSSKNLDGLFADAENRLLDALSAAPDHAEGHLYLGHARMHTRRAVEGIASCERALTLNRNLAYAHTLIGLGKIYAGRPKETEEHIQHALRISPHDSYAYMSIYVAGFAKSQLGEWDNALVRFRRSIEMNRNLSLAHFLMASTLVRLGREDEARVSVAAGCALIPGFTISRARGWMAFSQEPNYLASVEAAIEALRHAGLPEA